MLTVENEDDVVSIFDAWIRVPENVPPEQSDHVVVGLAGNLTEQSSLNLEAYYKNYGSLVVYNRDKVDGNDPDYVQGTGRSYGVELMVRSKIEWIDLYGAYSLSWALVDNQGIVYYPRYDRRPAKGLSVSVRWEFGSGFPFSQTVGYFDQLMLGGALPGEFERETGSPYLMIGAKSAARLPAYHRLDASLAYDVTLFGFDISMGLDLLNLYDNKNFFYFDRKIGQRIDMLPFYPSASLTVKY
jgi:outer membrane receptor protein involved in Fe transport